MNRRHFLASATLAGSIAISLAASEPDPVRVIGARIRPPVFPARDFDITRYGAVADATTESGTAVAKAIAG